MAGPISLSEVRRLLDYDPETGVFRWKAKPSAKVYEGDIAGSVNPRGYRRITLRKRELLAHRLAWFHVHGRWPFPQIDHANGKFDDNRIANLREVTSAQNCWNRRSGRKASGGFKGVYRRRYAWESTIMRNGKTVYLGHFKTAEAARVAYCAASSELHGEFAREE